MLETYLFSVPLASVVLAFNPSCSYPLTPYLVASVTSTQNQYSPQMQPPYSLCTSPETAMSASMASMWACCAVSLQILIVDIVCISTYGPALFLFSFVLNSHMQGGFLSHGRKSRSCEGEVDRLGYLKIKSFSTRKGTMSKVKRQNSFHMQLGLWHCSGILVCGLHLLNSDYSSPPYLRSHLPEVSVTRGQPPSRSRGDLPSDVKLEGQ